MEVRQDLKERNMKYIQAIIEKAGKCCPGSLAIVGINGSFMTGDYYEKSDLDLLLLINDDDGWKISKTFIQDDIMVGHDFYCTPWARFEEEAEYVHPHLSKLLEAEIVWCADEKYRKRLEELREHCRGILQAPFSMEDCEKAEKHLREAEHQYAEALLSEELSKARTAAGNMVNSVEDTLMMLNKAYYRRGVRRAYEELRALPVKPENVCDLIDGVILSESLETLKAALSTLLRATRETFREKKATLLPEKETPGKDNITGTYEEFFSNWRNKMLLAAKDGQPYLSFMSLASANGMFEEIAEGTGIGAYDVMKHYDPQDLQATAAGYISETDAYLSEYEKAGMKVARYPSPEVFIEDYLKDAQS